MAQPETDAADISAKAEMLDFLADMTCSTSMFWPVLVIACVLVLLLWMKGYNLMEGFRRMNVVSKWITHICIILLIFFVGCCSQLETEQHYGGWFALPVTAMLVSLTVVIVSVVRWAHRKADGDLPSDQQWQRQLLLLAKFMVFVWSCGWALYFVAIGLSRGPHVGAELLLRSAICSLDLFMIDFDSNIFDSVATHDMLKGMIVCTGFAAMLCTVTLLLGLVVSRLTAHLHLRHIHIDRHHNHLYIFFGINDASKLLVRDILNKDKAARIIYVENSLAAEAEDKGGSTDGKETVKSLFIHRRNKFVEVEDDGRKALAIANIAVHNLNANCSDVWNALGLQTVRRILTPKGPLGRLGKDAELHLFFLSDNREENIQSTAVMSRDTTIGNAAYLTTIYCHARRTDLNCVLEVENLESDNSRLRVRVLDSSSLALEHLRGDVDNHPVSFVDVEPLGTDAPGMVTSAFTSLIVGFGETGQEATKFLYEFGAFAGCDAGNGWHRSPFHCHIVDRNLDELKGQFIASAPGVSFNGEDDGVSIHFHHLDYHSREFYEEVLTEQFLQSLNYVVVSLGDDERNMAVGVSILKEAFRLRKDMRHFCVYVRVRETDNHQHMQQIARHYNRWMESSQHDVLRVFGQHAAIYTFKNIIDDQYLIDGETYYEQYADIAIGPVHPSWSERRTSILQKDAPLWSCLQEVHQKEMQDRSNAVHAMTKLRMMKLAGAPHSTYEEMDARLKENLAHTEHLRWCAANELMGYVYGPTKDYKRKTHPCIQPWENIAEETRAYDYIVVETSLLLHKNDASR